MKKLIGLFLVLYLIVPVSAQTRIKLTEEHGVYEIPCKVNGLPMDFIFDTGASYVSISSSEAAFMVKHGYLNKDDFHGNTYSQIANGDIIENIKIKIKKFNIGEIELHNIEALIVDEPNAPLLLGQSAIKHLGTYKIEMGELVVDYTRDIPKRKNKLELIKEMSSIDEICNQQLYELAASKYTAFYKTNPDEFLRHNFNNYGKSLFFCEKYDEAIFILQKAKNQKDIVTGGWVQDIIHKELFETNLYIGNCYFYKDDLDNALMYYQEAFSLAEESCDFSHICNYLASLYSIKKVYFKAEEYYEKSAENYLICIGANENDLLSGKLNDELLGIIFWKLSLVYSDWGYSEKMKQASIKSALCNYPIAIKYCDEKNIDYKKHQKFK